MLKTLVIALCGALLVACATPSAKPDFDACRSDLASAPGVESLSSRTAFLDACMARKGWRPNPACAELRMEGTGFCTYVRVR